MVHFSTAIFFFSWYANFAKNNNLIEAFFLLFCFFHTDTLKFYLNEIFYLLIFTLHFSGEEKNEKEVQASTEKQSGPQQVYLKVIFCSSITNL